MATELPFVDELETVVEASVDRAFLGAAYRMRGAFEGFGARAFSRLVGCVHRGRSFTVPPVEGQEGNGFRVARVDGPRALILEGQHRFATYRLSIFVDPLGDDRSRVRARTDALFPGAAGAMYRALVIGSGGHRILVTRGLQQVSRRAARDARAAASA